MDGRGQGGRRAHTPTITTTDATAFCGGVRTVEDPRRKENPFLGENQSINKELQDTSAGIHPSNRVLVPTGQLAPFYEGCRCRAGEEDGWMIPR